MNLKKSYVEKYGYERVVTDRNSPLVYAETDTLVEEIFFVISCALSKVRLKLPVTVSPREKPDEEAVGLIRNTAPSVGKTVKDVFSTI